MSSNTEKVLERVKKLVALSKSPNEHEAALAAERAAAILAEHNLSMSDLETEVEEEAFIIDEVEGQESRPYQRGLAGAVARLYFCRCFYTRRDIPAPNRKRGYVTKDCHSFVGAKHNVVVAQIMFGYLCEAVERLAKKGALTVPPGERSAYRVTFRETCSQTLRRRIYDKYMEAKKSGMVTESGTNLPALANLYDRTERELQSFLQQTVSGLRPSNRKAKILHGQGLRDGISAGENISLDRQLGGKGSGRLIGKS